MHHIKKIIDQQLEGKTIRYIARKVLKLSASAFSSLKFSKGILLNSVQAYADDTVKCGQVLEFVFDKEHANNCQLPAHPMDIHIVYEDDDYYILDKPAGLPTMYSAKQGGATLETGLFAYLGCPADYIFRPVNRLDKGTSGLMVVAKNAHAQQMLQKELHSPRFIRSYAALCKGLPPLLAGVINAPIGKSQDGIKRIITPDGKPSVTQYRLLDSGGQISLVKLILQTGRTHQIRVHLSSINCPILGDYVYGEGDDRFPGYFALHSSCVSFVHPINGKQIEVTATIPDSWHAILAKAKLSDQL